MKTIRTVLLMAGAGFLLAGCASTEGTSGRVHYTESCPCGTAEGDLRGCTAACRDGNGKACGNPKCTCTALSAAPRGGREQP